VDAEIIIEGDPTSLRRSENSTDILGQVKRIIKAELEILLMDVDDGGARIAILLHACDAIRLVKAFYRGELESSGVKMVNASVKEDALSTLTSMEREIITSPSGKVNSPIAFAASALRPLFNPVGWIGVAIGVAISAIVYSSVARIRQALNKIEEYLNARLHSFLSHGVNSPK
jgi:hypothetical protein